MTDSCGSGIPTIEACLSMMVEENLPSNVVEHTMAVEKLALMIAQRITDDVDTLTLVSRGALLHDIGRSQSHGIEHAVLGAEILRNRGIDPRIVQIVERHIGGGLTKSEAVELGLPGKDYVPGTLPEKIVAHADNLITGHGRWGIDDAVQREMNKNHMEQARRIRDLHNELSELAGIDIDLIS